MRGAGQSELGGVLNVEGLRAAGLVFVGVCWKTAVGATSEWNLRG